MWYYVEDLSHLNQVNTVLLGSLKWQMDIFYKKAVKY